MIGQLIEDAPILAPSLRSFISFCSFPFSLTTSFAVFIPLWLMESSCSIKDSYPPEQWQQCAAALLPQCGWGREGGGGGAPGQVGKCCTLDFLPRMSRKCLSTTQVGKVDCFPSFHSQCQLARCSRCCLCCLCCRCCLAYFPNSHTMKGKKAQAEQNPAKNFLLLHLLYE